MTEFFGVAKFGPRGRLGVFARSIGLVATTPHTRKEKLKMRETGRVKYWNPTKAFGFILSDQGGVDHFVHARSLPEGVESLVVGDRVSFISAPGKNGKGPAAVDVSVVR